MVDLYTHSLAVIRAGQAPSGAYVASPTFSQYGYSWMRDGAWIAYAMDCAGQHDSAKAFYRWVAQTILGQQDRLTGLLHKLAQGLPVEETDYLPTRFTLDGAIDSSVEWQNFQLDGYGTWLWGLVEHLRLTQDKVLWTDLLPAVQLTIQYLAALWQSPNYDCWEEHRQHIHPATIAAIYGGLRAVQQVDASLVAADLPSTIQSYALTTLIAPEGHFMKFLGNHEVDSSLLWVGLPYRLVELESDHFQKTLAKVAKDLQYPTGGVYRYLADTYFGGGEWLLLAAWLGWAYVELGRREEAQAILTWIEAQAKPNGDMPEQVSAHLLAPHRYQEWETRWGTVASPLLWSHAMYMILKLALERPA